jgi:hypothetical protein
MNKTENKRNGNCSEPVSLKETGPATKGGLAHRGTQLRSRSRGVAQPAAHVVG